MGCTSTIKSTRRTQSIDCSDSGGRGSGGRAGGGHAAGGEGRWCRSAVEQAASGHCTTGSREREGELLLVSGSGAVAEGCGSGLRRLRGDCATQLLAEEAGVLGFAKILANPLEADLWARGQLALQGLLLQKPETQQQRHVDVSGIAKQHISHKKARACAREEQSARNGQVLRDRARGARNKENTARARQVSSASLLSLQF